jgi:methylated-DNA-protein-cysteine methyltransferase-like protein
MHSSPPDPKRYAQIVWDIVTQIPRGVVSTYGQIASMIPPPPGVEALDYVRLAPLWVGKALNAVSASDEPGIPWQRVINGQGGISLPEGSRAALEQRARLENEGVTFDEKGRVDLKTFGWDGPPDDWLAARGLLPPRQLKPRRTGDPGQMSLL